MSDAPDEGRLTMERVDRLACLRAAVAILQPYWAKREPGEFDASDAITLARYIETGKDPYADVQPVTSPDAMRSHP